GSTGFGVAHAASTAAKMIGLDLHGATVAIHGFGNVGTFTYRYLRDMGATIVAIADRSGAVYASAGLNHKEITEVIDGKKLLYACTGRSRIETEAFWQLPVDILIPASVTDVINEKNKDGIRAKIIVEAGNIPMREEIEDELFQKGVFVVPDFVANAGGVISSYAEYRGYNPKRMFDLVERKIKASTKRVMEKSLKQKKNPRKIALAIAKERVTMKGKSL
ncbi:MAG: Glu/Leu/Phe/Val dehydrogenase, partial [Candidatus Sungbacteria bacterium]|nr:Glu/Leu/Phe/Val dehydrogenase [Candidatus Sungbacteria bacterium]